MSENESPKQEDDRVFNVVVQQHKAPEPQTRTVRVHIEPKKDK